MQIYIKKATLQNDSAAFYQTYFRLWIIQLIIIIKNINNKKTNAIIKPKLVLWFFLLWCFSVMFLFLWCFSC